MKDQLRVIQRLWGIGGACWSLGEILLTDTGSTVLTLMGLSKQVTPTLQALLGSVFSAAAAAALLWAGLLGTGPALSGVSQRVSLLVRRPWLKYRAYLRSIFRTAVVAIGVCATLTAAMFVLIAASANTDSPAFVYSTQHGQRGIVRIGNAVITLTPETEIAVSGTLASVWLKHGEAEISMRHDPMHPITIMVDDLAVCDVGTRFSVRREAGRTIVSVIEGSVQLDCHGTRGIHEWLASMFRSAPPIVPVTLNAGAKAEVPERSPDAHFIESRLRLRSKITSHDM